MSHGIRLKPPLVLLEAGRPCEGRSRIPGLSDAPPASDGIRYLLHDSHLLIDSRPLGGPLFRLAPWSLGLGLERWVDGWVPEHRDLDPLPDPRELRGPGRAAVAALRRTIPKAMRRLVPATAHLQLTMLRFAGMSSTYARLLERAPTCAWLLAWTLADDAPDARRVNELVARGDEAILVELARYAGMDDHLAGPDGAAAVAALSKLRFPRRDLRELHWLMRALEVPRLLQWLDAHGPVHMGHLARAASIPRDEAGHLSGWLEVHQDEALDLDEVLRPGSEARLAAERGARVDRFVEWGLGPLGLNMGELDGVELPEPRLKGDATIVPVRSARELVNEGLLMRHCAANLLSLAMGGGIAVYRVLEPERATLAVRQMFGEIAIQDLALADNEAPSEPTRRRVEEWFARALAAPAE